MTHGTYAEYAKRKCRCEKCRAYQNNRVAKNRAERLAEGRISHGTRSGYDAGCRCDECRARRIQASTTVAKHNHMTRDIKPYGVCPACDYYHVGSDV